MADNHSFDVVSEINQAEMHNAVVQAQHEIAVRYDFKGTKASLEFNKKDNAITILADHKAQLETVLQTLKEKMAKRSVPVGALVRGKIEDASHNTVRETLTLHTGIDTDDARGMAQAVSIEDWATESLLAAWQAHHDPVAGQRIKPGAKLGTRIRTRIGLLRGGGSTRPARGWRWCSRRRSRPNEMCRPRPSVRSSASVVPESLHRSSRRAA